MTRPQYPAVYPTPATLIAETPMLRRVLRRVVARVDVDDILQEILCGAMIAVREGRYQPDPTLHPNIALRRWLSRIGLHKLTRYLGAPYRRYEIPVDVPDTSLYAKHAPDLEERLIMLQALRALVRLPPPLRDVATLAGLGWTPVEIAVHLGIPYQGATRRLGKARRALATLIREG